MRLLADVEEALEEHRDELRPMLEHYGLVFEITPAELDASLAPVLVQGSGADLALGDADSVEAHGGG